MEQGNTTFTIMIFRAAYMKWTRKSNSFSANLVVLTTVELFKEKGHPRLFSAVSHIA
jgi:hypothetical protein